MSDRWADTDAFAEAKKVVQRIGAEAARQDHPQLVHAACGFRAWHAFQRRRRSPICSNSRSAAEFADKLSELLAKIKVTQTAAGPLPALQAVGPIARRRRRRTAHRLPGLRFPRAAMGRCPATAEGVAAARATRARRSNWSTASIARGPTWRLSRSGRPRESARRACRGSWKWPCRTSAPRRPATCRSSWARTDTAGRRSRWRRFRRARRPRSGSWCIFPTPARTRSPPGWKATPWRPTTIAIARSTCRRTCRCCWSMATPRPATPAT